MILWVVGKHVAEMPEGDAPKGSTGVVWELQGVFDSQELAEQACTLPVHFIGPIEMNVRMPEESTDWEGLYWPCLKM